MSLANPALPRRTHAADRRCSGRCFFLSPSRKTNRILGYCLGYALFRHPAVRLTAFLFHSNHWHLVLSADDGDLSSFFALFNSLVARAMNCHLRRGENLWVPGGTPKRPIFGVEGIWDQLTYCTVNPVKDGMVESPEAWPGLISLPEDVGTKTFRFERPEEFFRAEGDDAMPDAVEFTLEPPVELESMDPEEFRREYRERLDARVAKVHVERRGKPFMGAQQIRDQDPLASAGDTFPDRDRDPRIVCKDKDQRIGILRWLSEFRFAHRVAYFFWSRGARDTIFPAYTYLMRVRHGVRCRDPALFGEAAFAAA